MTRQGEPEDIQLVWGASEIATVIGRSTRATFHMLDSGKLPAKKIGGRWVSERGRLIKHLLDETAV